MILESLIYLVQKLFSIREDYYREQNKQKIKHLENGDYYEYMLEILKNTREEFREERLIKIIDSIGERIKNN